MSLYSDGQYRLSNPRSKPFHNFIKEKGLKFSDVGKHRDYYWEYIRTLDGTDLGKEFNMAKEYGQEWKMKLIRDLITSYEND